MRRHRPAAVGLLLSSVLTVTACTGGAHAVDRSTTSGSPTVAVTAGSVLPTVTGAFGERPLLTFPSSGPLASLTTCVVS
jgi:hypothetical protein